MFKKYLSAALFFLLPSIVAAQEFPRSSVPDPLKTWIPWVLDQQANLNCPHPFDSDEVRSCQWPSVLELKVGAKGAEFTQTWQVFGDTWISLPGDEHHWPLDVLVDGKALPVISQAGKPSIRLDRGTYKVSGRFYWSQVPESLGLAQNSGLVRLEMNGKLVAHPVLDDANRIWLQKKQEVSSVEQTTLKVFRKIKDGIPVMLETRFHLEVSGKARELSLGRALLPKLIPQALHSNLTATLNEEGNLLVQARPGIWDISFVSRLPADLLNLSLPAASGILAEEEVWVYEANPAVRLASVEGPTAIDAQQTTLPDEWRHLPAYLMRPVSSQFSLKQIRRGDSEPTPDKLKLQRDLWLSFDGKDMTMSDSLSGKMSRPARLTMVAQAQPGRIEVNGQDQQISSGSDHLAGVEVQGGDLKLKADSRLPQAPRTLLATLWKHDLDALDMNLHLPPGWRLLHASGVDHANGAWLTSWDLFDIFLILITTLVAAHLWGKKWGVVTLVSLVLSYQELDAPRGLWMLCFSLIALYRVLPQGKFKQIIQWIQRGSVLVLLVLSLAFATMQIRGAIYPVLENESVFLDRHQPQRMVGTPQERAPETVKPAAPAEAPPPMEPPLTDAAPMPAPAYIPPPEVVNAPQPEVRSVAITRYARGNQSDKEKGYISSLSKNVGIDPDAKVQTGPGLPLWQWRSHPLTFDGPVTQEQEIHLWLLSPWASKIVVVLRLVLLSLLLLLLGHAVLIQSKHKPVHGNGDDADDQSEGDQNDGDQNSTKNMKLGSLLRQIRERMTAVLGASKTLASSFVICGLLGLAQNLVCADASAQTPSDQHLQELREKLTRRAECLPDCAEISRLTIHVSGTTVRLSLDVDAALDTALPLPGGKKSWLPNEARLDGKTAYIDRDSDGALGFLVTAGRHRLELVGELLQNDTLQLPLPRKPRRVELDAPGWDVAGISDETGVADTIQLSRQVKLGKDAKKNAEADFPALLRVQRTLLFMKEWVVETEVERLSPKGLPVLAQIALLPGEAVNTAGVQIKDGQVLLNMGPQSERVTWSSNLKQAPSVLLKASDHCADAKIAQCIEEWSVLANNLWHLELKGVPPKVGALNGTQVFLPWAGETLEIKVERPQAVAGQTITIDQSFLSVTPGTRASDYRLWFVARSSRGLDHSIDLPKGAVLQKVMINEVEFPIRAIGQKLTLPIKPGKQEIEVSWRVDRGMTSSFSTDSVNLGLASVNSAVSVQVPTDRWLLAVGGDGMAPAILFWSKLIILLLLAIGLGSVKFLPVTRWQWILLALGMTQLGWPSILLTMTWFFACAARGKVDIANTPAWQVNLRQLFLVLHSLLVIAILLEIVRGGLLGNPDMQVAGNNSTQTQLNWYQDRIDGPMQSVWILSLPMLVYRGLMLLWALWLASSVIAWAKWAWAALSAGGLWKAAEVTVASGEPHAEEIINANESELSQAKSLVSIAELGESTDSQEVANETSVP
ncbi:hypothetical protein RF679_06500 [Undibacterium cyanobacteriorum]|uniref:Uncharacterized protein n=1 Tax=Undibacterium cyanobacteriorum TaxID=3073561 RepID=A0ABY9RML7_9BURK|nr:hypothetical protein [Undibacterium sp. 20NA77.5]WMW81930.1 hypothetical protein RF679_06500 [Undibacterium sp. 20NA77.5]